MRRTDSESRLPIERFASAYTLVVGLFLAGLALAIGIAML
jgi:hypothetical protein